jgi:ParB/RepB/Spo0J family partition protein
MQNVEREVLNINIDLIDLNPEQSRQVYDEESMNELASSIQERGLINPISVRAVEGRYKLLAGSRRLKAHKLLRRNFIRATIYNDDNVEELAIMAHENLFREDLSPLEEANFYARLLVEQNMTREQLIHMTGKNESYIDARITLLQCPDFLKEYVHKGTLKISAALELNRFPTKESIQQYTEYAVSSGASIATIRYWRQQVEAMGPVPASGDAPPAPQPGSTQTAVFGWNCYGCGGFAEAQNMMTIHICQTCFVEMEKVKHAS